MLVAAATVTALVWQWTLLIVTIAVAAWALVHVVLFKRDPRSAAYWVALILLVPLLGPVLYLLLGINFIRRRGKRYRHTASLGSPAPTESWQVSPDVTESQFGDQNGLALTLDRISRFHFTLGNRITILRNGDEAMEPMLDAIRQAERTLTFATYIFEARGIGAEFVREFAAAVRRGVKVRVIVDDAGTRYSWPPVAGPLRECGVQVRHFMPSRRLLRLLTLNLRNHRKILVADGKTGFTGGMNIRDGNMLSRHPPHPVRDLHFKVEGPVVRQMQKVFAEDWAFCTGEPLEGDEWFPQIAPAGQVRALGIPDGPDEDMEIMPVAFFAALCSARKSVKILNPYFLPLPALIWALKLCVTRGVAVTIVTPAKNNIPFVAWAARTLYPDLLRNGCRIFESPPVFDHSKIFLIDGVWSFVGSTNWDPRSLRLNFEFNLACCDRDLAARLDAEFQAKLAESRELTLAHLAADPLPARLRNGVARLFIPML